MYRAIIVDDELLVRVAYQSIIDWKQYGFELVGMFENGQAALAAFDELHPDFVLTDTLMPVCNGIELVQKIKQRAPDTLCVLLSAYGDLSYVKNGIRMGAEDYLLKLDITEESLGNLLRTMAEKLNQLKRSSIESVSDELQKGRDHFLCSWIRGEFAEAETVQNYLRFYKIKIRQEDLVCLRITIHADSDTLTEAVGSTIKQIVAQTLASAGTWVLAELCPGYLCAVGCSDTAATEKYLENLEKSIGFALKSIMNLTNTDLRYGIADTIMAVPTCFRSMTEAESIRSSICMSDCAISYMESHFRDDISLDSMAQFCGISPAYLSRIFAKEKGIGIQEYLTNLRLEHAKKLLANTRDKIYEVAKQSGYVDAVYFNKVFKKHIGVTPKEYRMQNITRNNKSLP